MPSRSARNRPTIVQQARPLPTIAMMEANFERTMARFYQNSVQETTAASRPPTTPHAAASSQPQPKLTLKLRNLNADAPTPASVSAPAPAPAVRKSGRASKPSTRLQHPGENGVKKGKRPIKTRETSRSPCQTSPRQKPLTITEGSERHDSPTTTAASVVQETTTIAAATGVGVETRECTPVPVTDNLHTCVETLIKRGEDVYSAAGWLFSLACAAKKMQ